MHDEEMVVALVALVGTAVVFVTWIVMTNLTKVLCHSRDCQLKQKLAEQGMSPYEILQVVTVREGDDMPDPLPVTRPPVKQPSYSG